MRILLQPSDYRFLNAGDAAMMDVAVRRLLALWPAVHFHVLTDHPEHLPPYSDRITAVSNEGRCQWSASSSRPGILQRLRLWRHPEVRGAVEEFLQLVENADAFVVTGMGGLTSAFPEYSKVLLDTIELAASRSIPTILLGQGLGPFDGPLLSRAAAVLPRTSFIALREGLHGPRLLRDWGMDPAKWAVTGDDALETAVLAAPAAPGDALGVNLRLSDYSGVTTDQVEKLRRPILHFAESLGVPLRIIPISRLPQEADSERVKQLLRGSARLESPLDIPDTPERVITYIQGCRVVVTGSYHAGVFALAQGIPAVGLARSPYYEWKFQGLAHQFPGGCEVLSLNAPNFPERLATLLQTLWQTAPALGESLRDAARAQVAAGRAVYGSLDSLLRRHANQRWHDTRELLPEWDERTKLIAQLIPPGCRLVEFGAGRLQLPRYLPSGCHYTPSDLTDRGDGTVVLDLNQRPLPSLHHIGADTAVFGGVLEYIEDPESLVAWLGGEFTRCIVSYEASRTKKNDAGRQPEVLERRKIGWMNTLHREELLALFERNGFRLTATGLWQTKDGDEPIFVFEGGNV